MDQLLNVNPVSLASNLWGLRHLYDLVETHVCGIQILGVPPNLYGTLFSSVLLNKLPVEIRLLISHKVPEDTWSLDALYKQS